MKKDTLQVGNVYHGDCLELMPFIPSKSIDMILCDLPWLYGTTACSWDTVIPFEPLWEQYKRIVKDNAAIVLFGSQPFTTFLIASCLDMFRYELIWEKSRPSNCLLANKMPLKYHENIILFYKSLPVYNPEKTKGQKNHKSKIGITKSNIHNTVIESEINVDDMKYPRSVIKSKSLDPI